MVQPMSSWGSSVTCLSNVDGGLMDVEMGYLPPMVFPPIVAIGGSLCGPLTLPGFVQSGSSG